jgi:putative membrane protein
MRVIITLAILLFLNIPAFAHSGGVAVPDDVWTHWNFEPLLLASLLLSLALYVRGMVVYPIARWRKLCFVAGITVLFIALVSPLEAMSTALFSAHMVQHLLLILVVAPLLTVSRPLAPVLRALPRAMQKSIGNLIQKPALQQFNSSLNVFMLNLAALAFWHLPTFYEAAFTSDGIHALEHASFLLAAALKNYGARILLVFAVMMTSGLLGALMSFASTPWYSHHADYVGAWGLSLLEDQQLAGMFMWIPPGIVYALTAALVLAAWLSTVERNTLERERRWAKEGSDA